jgi:hypothetical protein
MQRKGPVQLQHSHPTLVGVSFVCYGQKSESKWPHQSCDNRLYSIWPRTQMPILLPQSYTRSARLPNASYAATIFSETRRMSIGVHSVHIGKACTRQPKGRKTYKLAGFRSLYINTTTTFNTLERKNKAGNKDRCAVWAWVCAK